MDVELRLDHEVIEDLRREMARLGFQTQRPDYLIGGDRLEPLLNFYGSTLKKPKKEKEQPVFIAYKLSSEEVAEPASPKPASPTLRHINVSGNLRIEPPPSQRSSSNNTDQGKAGGGQTPKDSKSENGKAESAKDGTSRTPRPESETPAEEAPASPIVVHVKPEEKLRLPLDSLPFSLPVARMGPGSFSERKIYRMGSTPRDEEGNIILSAHIEGGHSQRGRSTPQVKAELRSLSASPREPTKGPVVQEVCDDIFVVYRVG